MDKDLRLSKLVGGEYRLWRDGYTTMVPLGMSITKPERPENISTNVTVYGGIEKSVFKPPVVVFTNTETTNDKFDEYIFLTKRPGVEITPDNELNTGGGIKSIRLKADIRCSLADTPLTDFAGVLTLCAPNNTDTYLSEPFAIGRSLDGNMYIKADISVLAVFDEHTVMEYPHDLIFKTDTVFNGLKFYILMSEVEIVTQTCRVPVNKLNKNLPPVEATGKFVVTEITA